MNVATREPGAAGTLLWSMRSRGVELWVEGGQIRYRAPRGVLHDCELSLLKTYKEEVTRILQEVAPGVDDPLGPRAPESIVPLTAVMMHIWRSMEKRATTQSERSCTVSMRIAGPLNLNTVQRCVQALVDRHESLRTRIVKAEGGQPRQQIDREQRCTVQVTEIGAGPGDDTDELLQRHAEEFAHEKVELPIGPLFAARIFKVSASDHVFIMAIDHLLADGMSLAVLNREFWSLYEQVTLGVPVSLPSLPIQFPDYAVWQERNLETWQRTHGAYWKSRLRDAPVLSVPRDTGLVEVPDPVGEELRFRLGIDLSERLRDLARQTQTLTPLVIVAIHLLVMSRWYEQRDLTLNFVGNGRYRPELHDMIGFLADVQYLRLELHDQDTFVDVIRRVTAEYHTACDHPGFHRLPAILPEYSAALPLNFQPYNWIPWLAASEWQADVGLSVRSFELKKVFPAPFAPFFYETAQGVGFTVVYRPDYLRRKTVERYAANMLFLANSCVADPQRKFESMVGCLAEGAIG